MYENEQNSFVVTLHDLSNNLHHDLKKMIAYAVYNEISLSPEEIIYNINIALNINGLNKCLAVLEQMNYPLENNLNERHKDYLNKGQKYFYQINDATIVGLYQNCVNSLIELISCYLQNAKNFTNHLDNNDLNSITIRNSMMINVPSLLHPTIRKPQNPIPDYMNQRQPYRPQNGSK